MAKKLNKYDFEYKRTKDYLTCKICGERIHCDNFINHIHKEHNDIMTYQEYFEKFYCIPANNNYELTNVDDFLIILRDYYNSRFDRYEKTTVENIQKHFDKALKDNKGHIQSFYFRFYQRHTAICQYLKLKSTNRSRSKRAELDALGVPHNDTKPLITNMSRHKCPICQQEQYASHYFKHIVTVHKMSKHNCLVKYFNIPDDTDTEDLTFTMLLGMQKELQQSQYFNYKDLYINIVQKCPNAIELKQNYDYDIIRVLKALNIPIKTQSTLNWQYDNNAILYAGYREDLKMSFRSTWEANIARILNNSNISFIYESKKFILPYNGDTLVYIPDFYLPDTDTYIEVKGFWRKNSKLKVQLFREQYPDKLLIIIDKPIYKQLQKEYQNQITKWE